MATRKPEPDMSNEAALLEVESAGSMTLPEVKTPEHFARDCEFNAALEERFAARWDAAGRAFDAAQARARAARWRVNAQAWRGTGQRAA
jgi:hypothetical protein